jgi:nitrile hydratase accessory protein
VILDPCGGEPVFTEPWQAQAFALVLRLHEHGLFTWNEWAACLAQAIADAQGEGDPDLGDTYYRHWVAALERILRDKGIAPPLVLASLQQAWRIAAEKTPHGEPVRLNSASLRLAGLAPRGASHPG